MIRITLVMGGNEEGGLEKHVIELANGLAELGHQVSLIAHQKYADRVLPEVAFIAVDLSKSRRNPVVLWQLYQAIKHSNPDVLHVHANKAVAMVRPLLKWFKVPSVATAHNIKSKVKFFMQFDRIIVVSKRAALQFADDIKVRVVLNGVRLAKTAVVAAKPWRQDNLQAIAIGRLVDVKGFDILIDAWQGINAKLLIVGDGPEQEALQQKINTANLNDKIELLGYRSDIADLITQSDFFVISSRHEGGPYTLAEALLLKRPVLSTDVGMVSEVLPAQFIVEPDNAKALHELIIHAIQQPTQLQAAFESVYEQASQQLTFEAMLNNTVMVYRDILH